MANQNPAEEAKDFSQQNAERVTQTIGTDTQKLVRDGKVIAVYCWAAWMLCMLGSVCLKSHPMAACYLLIFASGSTVLGSVRLWLARSRVTIGMDYVCGMAKVVRQVADAQAAYQRSAEQTLFHAKQLHNELSRRQGLPVPFPDVELAAKLLAN